MDLLLYHDIDSWNKFATTIKSRSRNFLLKRYNLKFEDRELELALDSALRLRQLINLRLF
jgi:hypothetical protein